MFEKIRYAVLLTCVIINPVIAMMSPDVIPCPATVTDELTAERLIIRARALFGHRSWRYYYPETLNRFIKIAETRDQDAINKAHVELNMVAISREFNKF